LIVHNDSLVSGTIAAHELLGISEEGEEETGGAIQS
jgi:hypothetical protein